MIINLILFTICIGVMTYGVVTYYRRKIAEAEAKNDSESIEFWARINRPTWTYTGTLFYTVSIEESDPNIEEAEDAVESLLNEMNIKVKGEEY